MSTEITSIHNSKIKEIVRLRKTSQRKKNELIVIEGYQEINIALAAGLELMEIFYCPEYGGDKKLPPDMALPTNLLTEEVFAKISVRGNPDGFLALAKPRYFALDKIKLSPQPLIIVIEAVEKPGNLGAMLRTADAVAADAVIVTDQKTDIYNHNVIRSSLGTVFTNQVVVCSTGEAIDWLRAKKINSFASTPHTDKLYTKTDFNQPAAIIVGTENTGLSDTWLKAADEKIRIPMLGKIDSLNASVSLAVILYEVVRQRGK